jgi:hypothetical protein
MFASQRKSAKLSRFTSKFGTAEKIQTYVNKYLESENNKIKIEDLFKNISQITHTALIEYIHKNRNMYLDYGPSSSMHEAFVKLCRAYDHDEDFFSIVVGDVFESKFEKPSFRKIKCLWVFHELMKQFKQKSKSDAINLIEAKKKRKPNSANLIEKFDSLGFIEEKITHLTPALVKCTAENLDITLGVDDFEMLMLAPYGIGPDGKLEQSSSKKTRKNSARLDLKKSSINY